jgi:hypothetical protein
MYVLHIEVHGTAEDLNRLSAYWFPPLGLPDDAAGAQASVTNLFEVSCTDDDCTHCQKES